MKAAWQHWRGAVVLMGKGNRVSNELADQDDLRARVDALESRLSAELERLARRDAVVAADRAKLWQVGNRRWEQISPQVKRNAEQLSHVIEQAKKAQQALDSQRKTVNDATSRLRSELATATDRVIALERDFRRWVKLNGISYINKEALATEMQFAVRSGVTDTPRAPRIIVSLTSTPWRMYDIHYTLHSLLSQSLKPDKVVLWLGAELFPDGDANVPHSVLALRERGLEIEYCHDVRSFTKLVPALERYPDDIIVTADDDIFYPGDWLQRLVARHESVPGRHITAALSRRVLLHDGQPEPYARWPLVAGGEAELGLLPLGVGGVLYPPRSLDPLVLDEASFMALCPSADDLWFWAMALRNSTPILPGLADGNPSGESSLRYDRGIGLTFVNPQRELGISGEATLGGKNVHDKNSTFFDALVERWPVLRDRLESRPPHVSVLLAAHGASARLRSTLNNLLAQELRNIEIVVSRVSTDSNSAGIQAVVDEFARRDARVKVVRDGFTNLADGLNAALEAASGEYVAFVDSASDFAPNYLARLYAAACRSGVEIARAFVSRVHGQELVEHAGNSLIKQRFDRSELLEAAESPLLLEGSLILRSRLSRDSVSRLSAELPWVESVLTWMTGLLTRGGRVVPVTSVTYRQHDAGIIDPPLNTFEQCVARLRGYGAALASISVTSTASAGVPGSSAIDETVISEWFQVIPIAARRAPEGWADTLVQEAASALSEAISARGFVAKGGEAERPWLALASAAGVEGYLEQQAVENLKVCVVVPVLNNEVDIDAWMTSVERQTLSVSRYEVLFVDRGSVDRSAAILEQLQREVANVRFVPFGAAGSQLSLLEALERGAAAARAGYVILGDVRRPLENQSLRRLAGVATNDALELVIGVPRRRQPSVGEAWDWRRVPAPTTVHQLSENAGLLHTVQLGITTSLIRTEVLQRVLAEGIGKEGPAEQELMARLLAEAQGLSYRKEIPVAGDDEPSPALTSRALADRLRQLFALRRRYAAVDGISFWTDRVEEFVRRLFAWVLDAPLPQEDAPDSELDFLLEEFFGVCDDFALSHELEPVRVGLSRALLERHVGVSSEDAMANADRMVSGSAA